MTDRRDLSSKAYKKLRRAELFAEQGGLCFWCEESMNLLDPYPVGGPLAPKDCTLDHLRDRDNPKRLEWAAAKERRWVAACQECNHDRDVARRRIGWILERRA